jgi:hypothetical protein
MNYEPLINRMSTEDVNRMLEYTQTYPNSGQKLINTLTESYVWLDLKYDIVCSLNDVFGCGYNPSAISNLFETK